MKKAIILCLSILLQVFIISGCANRIMYKGDYPFKETDWIRNGEPIMFEDEAWYPTDDIENLLDSEVILIGQYRQALFYIEKRDVKPINRIYTKFDYHKYRVFLRME